jgi:hypothetical protein
MIVNSFYNSLELSSSLQVNQQRSTIGEHLDDCLRHHERCVEAHGQLPHGRSPAGIMSSIREFGRRWGTRLRML